MSSSADAILLFSCLLRWWVSLPGSPRDLTKSKSKHITLHLSPPSLPPFLPPLSLSSPLFLFFFFFFFALVIYLFSNFFSFPSLLPVASEMRRGNAKIWSVRETHLSALVFPLHQSCREGDGVVAAELTTFIIWPKS